MAKPHPELEALFAERLRLRDTMDGSQVGTLRFRNATHSLALRIHFAEQRHGRAFWRFRVCATCYQLRPENDTATRCLGMCITRIQAWDRWGVDHVVIIEAVQREPQH